MIVSIEEEESKNQTLVTVAEDSHRSGQAAGADQLMKPKSKFVFGADAGVYLLLRSRLSWHFENRKNVLRRKDDLLKDLNLDMLTGRTRRETNYF